VTPRNKARSPADQVSDLTAGRLSVYLRCLTTLEAAGVKTVSSGSLAERFHLNAAQIRKDLAYFGEFGVRGVGYYVSELRVHLRLILGLERPVRVGIIGAGNLGRALADYQGFRTEGFSIVALFDLDPECVGRRSRRGVPILHLDEFGKLARSGQLDIAVVAVPADAAQAVVNLAIQSGLKAILNFSPGSIQVPAGVKLKNVDLTVSLESLSFFLARGGADGQAES
jgi:redox-sensing transcriptional repressor